MRPHERLEVEWARWNGLDPAGMVVCASGTAALHLAFEALQLPPGSEVVCPDFAMVACPRSISLAGHAPVFVDCGDDLLMDVNLLSPMDGPLSERTAAILAVHIYGRRCDVGTINQLHVGYRKPTVVEDLAEVHGVRPHPDTDAACWSFYANKIVGGQEGGAVWFRDPEHAALARRLRCLGFTEDHDFRHVPRGMNYRLADALAELVLDSLERYPENLARRRQAEAWYDEACPPEWRMPPRECPWVHDVRIPGQAREKQLQLVRALNAAGIAARCSFWPMSEQEEYKGCRVVGSGNARRLAEEVLYLPLTPGQVTPEIAWRAFALLLGA